MIVALPAFLNSGFIFNRYTKKNNKYYDINDKEIMIKSKINSDIVVSFQTEIGIINNKYVLTLPILYFTE